MKPISSVILFLLLVSSAVWASIDSYHRAETAIVQDLDQALSKTLAQKREAWITPDTILSAASADCRPEKPFVRLLCAGGRRPFTVQQADEMGFRPAFADVPELCRLLLRHGVGTVRPASAPCLSAVGRAVDGGFFIVPAPASCRTAGAGANGLCCV